MGTRANVKPATQTSESTSGDKAGNIIGSAAVIIGIFGFALLIFFGM